MTILILKSFFSLKRVRRQKTLFIWQKKSCSSNIIVMSWKCWNFFLQNRMVRTAVIKTFLECCMFSYLLNCSLLKIHVLELKLCVSICTYLFVYTCENVWRGHEKTDVLFWRISFPCSWNWSKNPQYNWFLQRPELNITKTLHEFTSSCQVHINVM